MKVKQTGLLFKINPKDYRVGASPLITEIVNDTGDWIVYLPTEEKQYKDAIFDTMSCATFAALNVVETTLNFFYNNNLFSKDKLDWLQQNGYIHNGKFNLSDRFTAIVSGTTNKGNYLQNVWDSVRNIGVVPENDLPFGGNNQSEYLDKILITPDLLKKAKKFLEIIESSYEWTVTTRTTLQNDLKQCPLEVIINQYTHAVELLEIDHIFDTYPPFLKPAVEINYALKGIVRMKLITLRKGMKCDDVRKMQSDLKLLGYVITVDGDFGNKTEKVVKQFQKDNKLIIDGIAGTKTLTKILELKKNLK